jgi:lipoprotein
MKKLLYSCIAFCTLVLASCADQDVAETNATNNDGPGVKVSMTMEGEMQSDAAAATPNSRAIGYEVKNDDGFPTAKGLYNGVGASAQELATGTKVPVVLIFKSDASGQPVTKVKTMWTYTQGGKLTLEPSETFEMKSGTNLSQGTWYVCGILGGDLDNTNSNVKFDGFVEGYTPKDNSGNKTTFGAEIPYVFGWRKLETNQAKKTIKTNHAVKFKQFGSIVRLKVTNNTGFGIKYDGVRIITSNILVGQFDLSSFDNVATSDLADTDDNALRDATSNDYKKVFKAFNFTQRATTDAKITSLASTNKFSMHNDLSYYDYKFNDFVTLANGISATGYVYVWMAPKQQTVNIYNKQEGVGSPVETKQISKTQFMLMAMPTETSAGNKVVPTSINMIPAYGTRADYVSGRNYPAKGSVVYNFPPLSYIAKHSNFGTEAELSNAATQDAAHTETYSYSEIESSVNNQAKVPSGFMFAHHEYWRSILPQFYGFSGFRNNGTTYNCSMGIVSPARLPGWNETKLVYQSYSKGVRDSQGNLIAYMIGLSKQPDYISNTGEGQAYQGYAKNPLTRASSGVFKSAPWIDKNDYRYVMRWEDKNGNAILKQRYLGPRFVLDMDDIANEDFWAAPITGTYPNDVERIVPYTGIYDVAATLDPSKPAGSKEGQTWWYFNTNTVGKCAQYWTPDDAPVGGRYATQAPSGGAMQDNAHQAPKLSVTFRYSVVADDVSGFFNCYLYTRTPLEQDHKKSYVNDPRFVEGLIMKAPVRLWKTTPYAD